MEGAIEARLAAGVKTLGLALEPAQVEAMLALVEELADWNTRMNLTAIKDPAEVVDKHLLDSLAVLPHLKGLSVADIGTGAGFPGLPLAIADLDRRYTLVESTGKKAEFVRHAAAMLRLPNVEVVQGRAEALKPSQLVRQRHFARPRFARRLRAGGRAPGRTTRKASCHERPGPRGRVEGPPGRLEGACSPPDPGAGARRRALSRRTC